MGSLGVGLSNFTLTFHFHALEKEMATHSSILAWRILGTGEPGWFLSINVLCLVSPLFVSPCVHVLLLLLPSRFSRVRLCATPQTAAQQAPLSLGFSRQEHWSGLPFPSPVHESEVAQSCPTLSDPMDCSPPGSSIPQIFQARVLEWGAIAFSQLLYISRICAI